MPSKNRKPRKRRPKADGPVNQDVELLFTDNTVLECNGFYDCVKQKIELDFPYPDKWNIKTNLTLTSLFGEGSFVLDFNYDKNIYIIEYYGSYDIFHNRDIGFLSSWAQSAGWGIPQPSEIIIKDNLYFWKHMWEVLLIDSEYLDKRFGNRETLAIREIEDEEEENDE
jgi:hypothetical protein